MNSKRTAPDLGDIRPPAAGLHSSSSPGFPSNPGFQGASLIWRRLFHAIAGSGIPVAAIFAPWGWTVVAVGLLALVSLLLDLVRFRVAWLNRQFLHWLALLLKQREFRSLTGATYMLLGALLAFLLFEKEVAVVALLFLSLGDPVAALVGRKWGGPRLLGKSPAGTVVFAGVSLGIAAVLAAAGVVPYHWGLAAGAVAAGLAELLPVPPDDNVAVPLAAGAVMHLAGM